MQVLNEHEPTVLHYTGHGDRKVLVLHDDEYGEKRVTAKALRAAFEAMGDHLRLVVLSSCYSENQAKIIVDTIGCVVAIKGTIGSYPSGRSYAIREANLKSPEWPIVRQYQELTGYETRTDSVTSK